VTGFYLWFRASRGIKASYQNISVKFDEVVPPVNSLVPEDKTTTGTTRVCTHMHECLYLHVTEMPEIFS